MNAIISWAAVLLAVSVTSAGAALPSSGERLAAMCAGCHGTRGASPGTHIPVIGGQSAEYVKKAMKGFKDGSRPGGVMSNLAKGYSEQQLDDMSVAVAGWKWQNSPESIGKGKSRRSTAGIESCTACHGKKGTGTPLGPHIAGQPAGYIREALNEYRTGRRTAPEMGMVKGLSEADVDRLAQYYSRMK